MVEERIARRSGGRSDRVAKTAVLPVITGGKIVVTAADFVKEQTA
ncbi:MAG TPA: hypothetical protein PK450_00945 [Paracoccaceae bacterium]|nr:hypothetical protein [Paracoccaceae bacterium]